MHFHYSVRKIIQPGVSSNILYRASLVKILHDIVDLSLTQAQSSQHKLILLCAPAGYGKTTLLADFAQHTVVPCCWYFLDHRDADPLVFTEFLIASLRQKIPLFGSALDSQLAAIKANTANSLEQFSQLEDCIDTIAFALATEVQECIALFLCNYHEINSNDSINKLVNRLLGQLPPHVVLVIESRSIPSLEIASLAARHQILGLGSSKLRFTTKEIQDLAHLQGVEIPSEVEANQIALSFEGWITGILLGTRLGGMLFPSSADKNAHSFYNNRQHLIAYLEDEVFKREIEAYKFLKEMSILEQMTPNLCNELLHVQDAADRLEYIERQGLFLNQSSDGKQQIYSCHTTLRELLYTEFYQQDPQYVLSLHRQAAVLFQSLNNIDLSINHAFYAQAYELACVLLEEAVEQKFYEERIEALLCWINMLPTSLFERSARLLLTRATIYTSQNEIAKSLPLLHKAQKLLEQETSDASQKDLSLLAEVLIAQVEVLLEDGDYQQAQQICLHVLTFLPTDERELRAKAYQSLGVCACLLGDLHTGITNMQQALHLWGHNTEIMPTARLHGNLANAYNMLGNYTLSEHHRTRAIAGCERLSDQRGAINNLIGMAITRRNKGDLDDAKAMLNQALLAARREHLQSCEAYALENLGEIYQDLQQFDRVLTLTEDALALARCIGDSYLANSILCTQSLTYLFMGDPATAMLLLEQINVKNDDTTSYVGALRELIRGTIYLFQKQYAEAVHSLKLAETSLETAGLRRLHLRALIRLSVCHVALKQQVEAMHILGKAASLATGEGYGYIAQLELERFPDFIQAMRIFPNAARFTSILLPLLEVKDAQDLQQKMILAKCEIAAFSSKIRMVAFGDPSVQIDGITITSWRMARSMELCFFLLDQKSMVHKEQIIETFWPETDSQVDQTLRSTVFYLRKIIGVSCVVYNKNTYCLDLSIQYGENIQYDVAIFKKSYLEAKQALNAEDDDSARTCFYKMIDLYSGDYVQSFYSDWCTFRRDELRCMYMDARRELALIALQNDGLDESIVHWQHMVAIDDCLEDAHYGLMRCYMRQGKRSMALRQYQRCVNALQKELNVAPGQAIKKFYQRLTSENN